jgi:cytochrome P450
MGFDAYLTVMRYGAMWRKQRRAFHLHFNPTVVKRYHSVITDERNCFLQGLLSEPSDFRQLTRRRVIRSLAGRAPLTKM